MLLKIFRLAAILEGISYLLLFGVSMPLKYIADIPEPNIIIGYAHGFLFIAYTLVAINACLKFSWSFKRFVLFFIAALLPFGTFYVDAKFLKPQIQY